MMPMSARGDAAAAGADLEQLDGGTLIGRPLPLR